MLNMKNLVILDQKVRAMDASHGKSKKEDVKTLVDQTRLHAVKFVIKSGHAFANAEAWAKATEFAMKALQMHSRQNAEDTLASRLAYLAHAEDRATTYLQNIVDAAIALETDMAASFETVPKYVPGDAASEAMVDVVWWCTLSIMMFVSIHHLRFTSAFII
jgi:hypothetical protein